MDQYEKALNAAALGAKARAVGINPRYAAGADTMVMQAYPDEDVIKLACQTLEADVDKDGWDRPAQVFLLSATDYGLGVVKMPLPEAVLSNPVFGLGMLLGVLNENPSLGRPGATAQSSFANILPDALFGIIIIAEAWKMNTRGQSAETLADLEVVIAERGPISEQPDRIEQRLVTCYTLDGVMLIGERTRNQLEPKYNRIEGVNADNCAEYGGLTDVLVRFTHLAAALAPSYVTVRPRKSEEQS